MANKKKMQEYCYQKVAEFIAEHECCNTDFDNWVAAQRTVRDSWYEISSEILQWMREVHSREDFDKKCGEYLWKKYKEDWIPILNR